jgi:16S rRNA (guanine527-N7)-methyltransferase
MADPGIMALPRTVLPFVADQGNGFSGYLPEDFSFENFCAFFRLSPTHKSQLSSYADHLERWNKSINLVSASTLPTLWQRHMADSAQLVLLMEGALDESETASHMRDRPVIVDFGSGAGFPGLVLAIITGWPTHLIESDGRKAAFLREAARNAHLPHVRVHAQRIEACLRDFEKSALKADIISARALADLPQLLDWASPILREDGFCLFPKGKTVMQEVEAARAGWSFAVTAFQSMTSSESVILRLSSLVRR